MVVIVKRSDRSQILFRYRKALENFDAAAGYIPTAASMLGDPPFFPLLWLAMGGVPGVGCKGGRSQSGMVTDQSGATASRYRGNCQERRLEVKRAPP